MNTTAEYGTPEYENNRSIYTVLEKCFYVDPVNRTHPLEFYHRTAGYKLAGSCAVWTGEVWGYKISWLDGTTSGKMWGNETTAREYWNGIPKTTDQPFLG